MALYAQNANPGGRVAPLDHCEWLAILIKVEFLPVTPPGRLGSLPFRGALGCGQRTLVVAEHLQIAADTVYERNAHRIGWPFR